MTCRQSSAGRRYPNATAVDLRRFLGISAGIARGGGRACAQRAAEEPFSIHPRLSATFLTNRATAMFDNGALVIVLPPSARPQNRGRPTDFNSGTAGNSAPAIAGVDRHQAQPTDRSSGQPDAHRPSFSAHSNTPSRISLSRGLW